MSIKNVSIIGANGNIGSLVIPELVKSSFSLTAVTRTTSTATFPASIKVVKGDFSLASLTEIFKGQDAVVSMLPITALGEQVIVIEAAIAAGVKRFIPSEYGSDSTVRMITLFFVQLNIPCCRIGQSDTVIAAVPFFAGKKQYLESLKSQKAVISWTALFTGPFFDWESLNYTLVKINVGLAQGFTGFNLATKTATLIDGDKTRFTSTNAAQIGHALVSILNQAEETANKLLEILAALEKAVEEKFQMGNLTSEDVRTEAARQLAQGNLLEGGGKLITALVLGKEGLEDHSDAEGGI
ncbi:hypothetical protein QQZ08_008291 [Neonectria magnoliae]|uniref:NAD(P)-binding domain-containing protein n=1 Tax=Neonectria magnoliae TaxID=2732573 RepID=A0ABR1HWM6_9HYPO